MTGKDVIQKNDVLLRLTAKLSYTSESVKKKAEDKTDKVADQQHSMSLLPTRQHSASLHTALRSIFSVYLVPKLMISLF